ncbi:MAG: RES family NAD+ phosphorylase [Bacteroidetes bacterium]|nr:RES family NAD+ phosphorylase [Bacteroidota bacterium]
MIIFRMCRKKYCNDLSGQGAEKSGGRWNSKGTPMVYTSDSRALCLTEMVVNLQLNLLPIDFNIVSILLPDDLPIDTLLFKKLPNDWNDFPHSHSTQKIGDDFFTTRKFVALKVPSAVVPMEFNIVINPQHPLIGKVKVIDISDFVIDRRLIKLK